VAIYNLGYWEISSRVKAATNKTVMVYFLFIYHSKLAVTKGYSNNMNFR
jgi:hypothetical protein